MLGNQKITVPCGRFCQNVCFGQTSDLRTTTRNTVQAVVDAPGSYILKTFFKSSGIYVNIYVKYINDCTAKVKCNLSCLRKSLRILQGV